MKIKLTQEVLDSGGLPSTGSHQGFTGGVWNLLNSGKGVEVDNVPEKSKDKLEEVSVKSPKHSSKKKKKKEEVKDGE